MSDSEEISTRLSALLRKRRLFWTVFLGGIMADIVAQALGRNRLAIGIGILWVLGFWRAGVALAHAECPRCRRPFYYGFGPPKYKGFDRDPGGFKVYPGIFADRCRHCGFPVRGEEAGEKDGSDDAGVQP